MPVIPLPRSTHPLRVNRQRVLAVAHTSVSRPVALGLAAFACLAAVRIADKLHFGLTLTDEGAPLLGAPHLARSAVIALGAACGAVAVAHATDRGHRVTTPAAERRGARVALAIVLLALASALLALGTPHTFSVLAVEDGPVETVETVALVVAAAVLGRAAWITRVANRATAVLLALGAAGAAVVAGEEVSWFQRQLHFATPASFSANLQHEFNLHNFATNTTEVAYYGGAWLFLVLAPFVCDHLRLRVAPDALRRVVPSRWTLLAASPLAAVNYDMWNAMPTQLAFFGTLGALAVYAYTARHTWERAAFGTAALACVAVQWSYVVAGPYFHRLWDATEYKELFIPLGLLVAAGELLARAHAWARAATTTTTTTPVAAPPVSRSRRGLPPQARSLPTPGTIAPHPVKLLDRRAPRGPATGPRTDPSAYSSAAGSRSIATRSPCFLGTSNRSAK